VTNATQTKPTPIPAVLVYGTPTSPELTQASWFRAEDKEAAKAAAVGLKFSVIDIETETERALTVGVHEGVLKGSGRMIVGSVSSEVYRRIEDYARRRMGADPAPEPERAPGSVAESLSEQNVNIATAGTAPSAPAPKNADLTSSAVKSVAAASSAASPPGKPEKPATPPDPWDGLRVGSHVVGKYWETGGQPNGWWIGVITGIDKNDFMIRWPDEPKTPPLKIERKHVAILHPTFDVN
jgi:hypothetical protein